MVSPTHLDKAEVIGEPELAHKLTAVIASLVGWTGTHD
jgi:hypothetical protein